jgi:hypothetical protein
MSLTASTNRAGSRLRKEHRNNILKDFSIYKTTLSYLIIKKIIKPEHI